MRMGRIESSSLLAVVVCEKFVVYTEVLFLFGLHSFICKLVPKIVCVPKQLVVKFKAFWQRIQHK